MSMTTENKRLKNENARILAINAALSQCLALTIAAIESIDTKAAANILDSNFKRLISEGTRFELDKNSA